MLRVLLVGVFVAGFGGAAIAAESSRSAGACVTLDDRPCYSDGAQTPQARAQPAAGRQAELGRQYVRAQAAKGNCASAWASAQRLADPALIAEIQPACGPKAQPKTASPSVQLW